MEKNRKWGLIGAAIWLIYIVIMWAKNGIKNSISALFGYIKGTYSWRRVLIGTIYFLTSLTIAISVWMLDIGIVANVLGTIGAAGLATAGFIPDSRDRSGQFNETKDKIHVIGTLIAIATSMAYIIIGSIQVNTYWMLSFPIIFTLFTLYATKTNLKYHTTWIELLCFGLLISFILIV